MGLVDKSSKEKWKALADQARADAETMPLGHERTVLLQQARELDIATNIDGWLSSPGLKPPTGK